MKKIALMAAFAGHEDVEILCGDILALASRCVISPANSFGYMDGGMDAAYYQFFGPSIQSTVQTAIQRRPEGMLPVGAALAVSTGETAESPSTINASAPAPAATTSPVDQGAHTVPTSIGQVQTFPMEDPSPGGEPPR